MLLVSLRSALALACLRASSVAAPQGFLSRVENDVKRRARNYDKLLGDHEQGRHDHNLTFVPQTNTARRDPRSQRLSVLAACFARRLRKQPGAGGVLRMADIEEVCHEANSELPPRLAAWRLGDKQVRCHGCLSPSRVALAQLTDHLPLFSPPSSALHPVRNLIQIQRTLWECDTDGSGTITEKKFNEIVRNCFGSETARREKAMARAKNKKRGSRTLSATQMRYTRQDPKSPSGSGSDSGGDRDDEDEDDMLLRAEQQVENVQLIHVRPHAKPQQLPAGVLLVPALMLSMAASRQRSKKQGARKGKSDSLKATGKPLQLPISRRTTIADIEAGLALNAHLFGGGGGGGDPDPDGMGATAEGDLSLTSPSLAATTVGGTTDDNAIVGSAALKWLKLRPQSAGAAAASGALAASTGAMFASSLQKRRGPRVFLDMDRSSRADLVGAKTLGDERVRGVGRTKILFVMDDFLNS